MLNDEDIKARLSALEQEIESIRNILSAVAVALDKVSQNQAVQSDTIRNLVGANEESLMTLEKVVTKTMQTNELLQKLPYTEAIEEIKNRLKEFETLIKKEGGVFISYSHADKEIVSTLVAHFEQDSINYWLDDKDLLVGEVIDKAISEGIQRSRLFIIVLSPSSIKSNWVEREFDEASYEEIEGRKIILPVTVSGLKVNKLPPRIRRKLFVNLGEDFESGYIKLRKSILTYMVKFAQKTKR